MNTASSLSRRLIRGLAGLLLSLASVSAAQADTRLSFTLDDSYTTSAGVFKADGTLIRTLWSKIAYAPGAHSYTWDDKNDAGETVPSADTCTFKIIYHNIDYTWQGVIGNTSTTFNGNIRRGFIPIVDMTTDGANLYSALGYNEGQSQVHLSTAAEPNTLTFSIPPSICTTMGFVVSDGINYYMANTGGGFDAGHNASFIIARKVADNSVVTFSAGVPLALQYFPGGKNYYPEHYFPSCINVDKGKSAFPTGLAVQKNGPVLAVAHLKTNEVRLLDKVSGEKRATLAITKPRKIAFAPNGDLWVVSEKTVQRFARATLGTTSTPVTTISGFERPQSVSVHPTDDDIVLVADAGASQQVKAFNRTGTPLWTYGTLGGGYADDPTITPAKLGFIHNRTFVTAMADGSFWVSDSLNNRTLHLTAKGAYIEQILYLPASYVATSDPNVPSRVIGGDWFEFAVDYSKPLLPGDPSAAGGNRSWTLKKNWGLGVPANFKRPGFAGLHTVVTLRNGRTYGFIRNGANGKHALVELPATGNLRITGLEFAPNTSLNANGDLHTFTYGKGTQTILRQSITGFDATGNPQWSEPVTLAVNKGGARYSGSFAGPAGPLFPVTESNLMISFNSDVKSKGMHLGAVPVGGTTWRWLASPSVPKAAYETYAGQNGTFSNGNGSQYAGNQVRVSGRNIIYGYHGEFYNGGQANQFMHFRDDGLFLGQFGTVSNNTMKEANYGQGGNSFSLSMVKVEGETYFWNNDESNHAGVHRWRLTGANNIRELTASGTPGSAISLGASVTTAPSQIIDNTAASGVTVTGKWTATTGKTAKGAYGSDLLLADATDKSPQSVRFPPKIPAAGRYQVYAWWSALPNRASNTPVDIIHASGTETVNVDQRHSGSRWILLGTYPFAAGSSGSVLIRTEGANGTVAADAVRLVYDDFQSRKTPVAAGATPRP